MCQTHPSFQNQLLCPWSFCMFHLQKQILIKFVIGGLHQQLLNEFYFGLFWSTVIPALCEA
jgi:hypothetical protein